MRRLGILYSSIALTLITSSAAGAAGEIDSHRVWGEGLFGMHLAPPDANGTESADGTGVYRDEFGALRDKSMLPDMLTDEQASQQVNNNGLSQGVSQSTSGHFESFAQPTAVGIPQRSTSALFSPSNMYTSPGLSANNMSYVGGYGQYGPINNLDLIRAGITSDLKTVGASQALNPVGVISNYTRVVMPSEPIPGRSVFMAAQNPRGLGLVSTPRTAYPVTQAQAYSQTTPPMVATPIRKSMLPRFTPRFAVTRVTARRLVPHPILPPASSANNVSSIGPVNGYIQYGDEKVTLFGSRGTLTETPAGGLVMRLPNNTVVLKDNASTRRQIAGLEKATF